jgi:hypothetical protein
MLQFSESGALRVAIPPGAYAMARNLARSFARPSPIVPTAVLIVIFALIAVLRVVF